MNIPYPSDVDYHADWMRQREDAIIRGLDVSDLLAEIDSILASEPDQEKHPLYAMAEYILNHRTSVSGAALYDGIKALCNQALGNLVTEAMGHD